MDKFKILTTNLNLSNEANTKNGKSKYEPLVSFVKWKLQNKQIAKVQVSDFNKPTKPFERTDKRRHGKGKYYSQSFVSFVKWKLQKKQIAHCQVSDFNKKN